MRTFLGIIVCTLILAFQAQAQTSQSALQIYRQGRDLEAQSRMSEANAHYNEAIRICQEEVSRNAVGRDTYTVITWALQRQNKYAEVIIWGERGLRVYSTEYRIAETMGEAYFYLGNYDRSLLFMQRYTNALPEGERAATAFFFIGEIYRLAQKYRHADIAYTTAVRFEPGIALWWYRLALVREQAGEQRQAIDAYQQSLRLNPNYREARDGLNRLQQ